MNARILVCGNVFDGISDALTCPAEIRVEDNRMRKSRGQWAAPPAHG
jgi:hypothetical protein